MGLVEIAQRLERFEQRAELAQPVAVKTLSAQDIGFRDALHLWWNNYTCAVVAKFLAMGLGKGAKVFVLQVRELRRIGQDPRDTIEKVHSLADRLERLVTKTHAHYNIARILRNQFRRRKQRMLAWLLGRIMHNVILVHDRMLRCQVLLAVVLAEVEPPQRTFGSAAELKRAMS